MSILIKREGELGADIGNYARNFSSSCTVSDLNQRVILNVIMLVGVFVGVFVLVWTWVFVG